MTPPPTLQDLIDIVQRDTRTDDPLDQLATASATAAGLSDVTDSLLGHFVDRARRDGRSWTEISGVLGVTKQAVHKRFADSGKPELGRYTDRARRTIRAATASAVELGHNFVGTEHLLLGFFAEPDCVAAKIIESHGGRSEIESVVVARSGRGETSAEGEPPLTPLAAAALMAAVGEALKLGHNYVGTEHVLLAFYNIGGLAKEILEERGLDAETARTRVIETLHAYRQSAT